MAGVPREAGGKENGFGKKQKNGCKSKQTLGNGQVLNDKTNGRQQQ